MCMKCCVMTTSKIHKDSKARTTILLILKLYIFSDKACGKYITTGVQMDDFIIN